MKRLKYYPLMLVLLGGIFLAGCYRVIYVRDRGYYPPNNGKGNTAVNQDTTYEDSTYSENSGGGYPYYGYNGIANDRLNAYWGNPFYWDPYYYDYWNSPYFWGYDPFFYSSFYYPYFGTRFGAGFYHGYGYRGYLNGTYRYRTNAAATVRPRTNALLKSNAPQTNSGSRIYRGGNYGRGGGFSRGGGGRGRR